MDFQTGARGSASNKVDYHFMTDQGTPSPVHADEGKQPVLNLVPLARTRRVKAIA